MKTMVVSDMHGQLEGLDVGDAELVLIAGDFAPMEGWRYVDLCNQVDWVQRRFCTWCAAHPNVQFRLIPGNHDLFAQMPDERAKVKWPDNARMLIDESDEVGGLHIYGTPWIPHINGRWAFEELAPGQLREKFAAIPHGLDVLLTHTPSRIRHKKVDVSMAWNSPHFGSLDLTDEIARKRPRFVFCGHIHTGDHTPVALDHGESSTTVYNVSRLDEDYEIAYEPLRLEI